MSESLTWTAAKILTTEVDISQLFGLPSSKKTTIIADTKENHLVPGNDEIKFGLNVYKKFKSDFSWGKRGKCIIKRFMKK